MLSDQSYINRVAYARYDVIQALLRRDTIKHAGLGVAHILGERVEKAILVTQL